MVPNNETDEPVAYLGGKAAEPNEPVEGYLGGDAPPDSLPALPPANMTGQYSASDFIPAPADVVEDDPPPQDDYAADAPPVEAPAEDPAYFQQYANDEPPTSDQGTATVAEQPSTDQTSEFDEPGLPKTISQQDAENIIKRITTKKILPPEIAAAEGPRVTSSPEHTPRGGLKAGPLIVFVALMLGLVASAFYFKEEIGPYLPPVLQGLIGFEPPKVEQPIEKVDTKTPEQIAQENLKKIVLESEWRAFGYENEADFNNSQKQGGAATGGDKKPTGTDVKTPVSNPQPSPKK